MQAPFKLALAALFLDERPRDGAEAEQALRPVYAGARFFTPAFVAYQLHSLKAVGILRQDEAGRYTLTGPGAAKVRKSL